VRFPRPRLYCIRTITASNHSGFANAAYYLLDLMG
jgi:hypothetical protein